MKCLRLGLSLTGGAAPFNPLTLFGGTMGVWYDISDISTLFQDTAGTTPVTANNDPVARVNDKSGNGNNLLLTGAAGQRPLYKVSGSLKYLLFDGTDDFLGPINFVMGTTWDRVSAIQLASTTNGICAFGGGSVDTQTFVNGSVQLQLWNNSAAGAAAAVSATTDYVVTERWSSAPSLIALDNGSYQNSPSIAGVNPGGITIGSKRSGFNPAGMRLYGCIMINRAMTAGEIANCRTNQGALQGRVL